MMTLLRTIFIMCVLLFVAKGNEEDFREIDSIFQEEPCQSIGGFCTIAADCPKGHLTEKTDLCPTQSKQGVECCHGLSLKETRCEKLGGACLNQSMFCNEQLVFDATDCTGDMKCCLLLM